MRLSRTVGVLTALGALAAATAHAQSTPAAPAPTTPAPGAMTPDTVLPGQTTLTPPGSSTSVPLLPATPDTSGGGLPSIPSIPYAPPPTLPGSPPPTLPGSPPPTLPGSPGLSGQFGAPAPTASFGSVFGNTASIPLRLTLGQLNSDWRRMTITGSLDFGTITQVISSLLGSAGVGAYYTKGQTVTLGSVTYLIAYQTQPRALDVANLLQMFKSAARANRPPAAERLTVQTPLALTLLNLQSAGSLTNVRAFDLNRELADSAAAVKAYNDLIRTFGPSRLGGTPNPLTLPPRVGRPKPRKTPQA